MSSILLLACSPSISFWPGAHAAIFYFWERYTWYLASCSSLSFISGSVNLLCFVRTPFIIDLKDFFFSFFSTDSTSWISSWLFCDETACCQDPFYKSSRYSSYNKTNVHKLFSTVFDSYTRSRLVLHENDRSALAKRIKLSCADWARGVTLNHSDYTHLHVWPAGY